MADVMEGWDHMVSGGDASGESGYHTLPLAERQRLVRELHDGPVQTLTIVALQVEMCQRLAKQGDAEALSQGLAQLAGTLRHGMADFRRIVSDLRQPGSGSQQLTDELRDT